MVVNTDKITPKITTGIADISMIFFANPVFCLIPFLTAANSIASFQRQIFLSCQIFHFIKLPTKKVLHKKYITTEKNCQPIKKFF